MVDIEMLYFRLNADDEVWRADEGVQEAGLEDMTVSEAQDAIARAPKNGRCHARR